VQHYDPKNGGNGVDKREEYVFDGLDPVAEYDKLNGQRTDYYRGEDGDIALMHQYKGGTQGQMYWYHYNQKGDVAGLTKQNGNSHHNYRYEPYGAVLPENGNFTDPHNHYTLTGKEFDENTGLVWFGARHYEPETGVWMGQDKYRGKLSQPGSLHRFGYVLNNPVSLWDWYGFKIRYAEGVSEEFKNQFANAIQYLNKAGVSSLIAELEARPEIVYLEEGEDSFSNEEGRKNLIKWSPFVAMKCTDGTKQTAALSFLHEAAHALGYLDGTYIYGENFSETDKDFAYTNAEEKRVINKYETPAAKKLNEGSRSDHYGEDYIAESSVSTKEDVMYRLEKSMNSRDDLLLKIEKLKTDVESMTLQYDKYKTEIERINFEIKEINKQIDNKNAEIDAIFSEIL
jgi:RHS repeat-associated protein